MNPGLAPGFLFVGQAEERETLSQINVNKISGVRNPTHARALAPGLRTWQLEVVVQFLHHGINAVAETWPKAASARDMTDLVVRLMWQGLETFADHSVGAPEQPLNTERQNE